MAEAEIGLIAYLKAHAGLTALVGASVFGPRAPGNATYPLLLMQRINTTRFPAMTHDAPDRDIRFQFTALARDGVISGHQGAIEVVAQLKLALSRGAHVAAGVTIEDVIILDEADIDGDPGTNISGRRLDVRIYTVE